MKKPVAMLLTAIFFGLSLSSCCYTALKYSSDAYSRDVLIKKKAVSLLKRSTTTKYADAKSGVDSLKQMIATAYGAESRRGKNPKKCNCISLNMLNVLQNPKGGLYDYFEDWEIATTMSPIVYQDAQARLDSTLSTLPYMESMKNKN